MIFSSAHDRNQFLLSKAQQVSFFALSGGACGLMAGGILGIINGAPLNKVLPKAAFRTSTFFATISAMQIALESSRQKEDCWNPILAGAGTGFIFGRGLYKSSRIGFGLALNAALINWAIQSFNLSKSGENFRLIVDHLNPVLTESKSDPLITKIRQLQEEIDSIKNHQNKGIK